MAMQGDAGRCRRIGRLVPLIASVVCCAAALPALAQDTTGVIIIDPDAPPVQLRSLRGPPPEVVSEAVAAYNDTTAFRSYGSQTVSSGTLIRGNVAVYRGTLRVVGRIIGNVTVVNGGLILGPLGTIEGDVLVVGGRMQSAPSARHTGALREYADPAPVFRTATGSLEVRERRPTLGDLATARTTFQAGALKATLEVGTRGSYNRVEGLPVIAGPTFSFPTPNLGEVRMQVHGVIRTEKDQTDQLGQFGWRAGFDYESRGRVRGGVTASWSSLVAPIEELQLTPGEAGWSSFLLRRDYEDYYHAQGIAAGAHVYPVAGLRVGASVRFGDELTVPASDPITLLRNDSPWRPNPLIDDGFYTTIRAEIAFDNRNSQLTPTSGWLVRASFERGSSDDVAPIALPTEVRDPIPTFRTYSFNKIWVDARIYARINQASRVNLRALGGGWLGGDPLPIQRRLSMGGPGILPGLPFRSQSCAPPSLTDPALTALCDRAIAAQAELRVRFPLRLRELLGADEWLLLDRFFGGDQADVVFFSDAGKGWIAGDGPGRVPSNRIPVLGEWDYDAGIGLDLGGFALYLAKSLSTSESPRLTMRLQRRF